MSEGFLVQGELEPGAVVSGYRIESRVGAGGMAVVFRARDERLKRTVALKVIAPEYAQDEEFRNRFVNEAHAAAAVEDPHVIPVYGAGEKDGRLFIAMRFVDGPDLGGVLRREGGVLPPSQALELLSPVASALDAAHAAGLVHRDVKPGNVLVSQRPGRPDHVYLSDFGLSKGALAGASGTSLTKSGQFLGTPAYSAPEQIEMGAVDGRIDQYALACMAYKLLTGHTPFEGEHLSVLYAQVHTAPPSLLELRPDLPAAADPVLARALAKMPQQRYPTCQVFTEKLREACGLPPYHSPGVIPPSDPFPELPEGQPAAGQPEAGELEASPTASVPDAGKVPTGPDRPDSAETGGQELKKASKGGRQRLRPPLAIALTAVVLAGAVALAFALHGRSTPGRAAVGGAKATTTPTPHPTATTSATVSRTAKPFSAALTSTFSDADGQPIQAVRVSPDGSIVAAADKSGTIHLWNTATGKATTLPAPDQSPVYSMAFSPNGVTLAAADYDGNVYLWDIQTGAISGTFTDAGGKGVVSVAYSPDGSTLTAGDYNGSVYLWNTATRKNTAILADPGSKGVYAVAFSPDGTTLAVGDYNGSAYLWNLATDEHSTFSGLGAGEPVTAVAFAPDSTTLALAVGNGVIYLADSKTRVISGSFSDPGGTGVFSAAFAPSGTLAVADTNHTVYLWNTNTKTVKDTFADPKDQNTGTVAFAQNGTALAVGDGGGYTYLLK